MKDCLYLQKEREKHTHKTRQVKDFTTTENTKTEVCKKRTKVGGKTVLKKNNKPHQPKTNKPTKITKKQT